MRRYDVDKSSYSRFLEADNRWYMPINELINRPAGSDKQDEPPQVEEIQKNDVVVRWNSQWKELNEIKNVKRIYIIYGNTTMSSMNFLESELTLVGAIASVSYCEYYCNDVLKGSTQPSETVTCIYALTDDMASLLILLNDKSFYPQKAYLLCDLLFKELEQSVKIIVLNTDKPKTSALAHCQQVQIPRTNFHIFYVKSKQSTNLFGDLFAPLPISFLVAGFPAAVVTYCEIYNIDCILFQYVSDIFEEDVSLRADYFYGFLSLLNPIFKSKIDEIRLSHVRYTIIGGIIVFLAHTVTFILI